MYNSSARETHTHRANPPKEKKGRSRSRSLVLLFGSSFFKWSFRLCLVFRFVFVFRAVEVTLPF